MDRRWRFVGDGLEMVLIRPALAADRDAVCQFLHEKMDSRIPLERWRRITDGRWAPDIPEFGMIAEDDGRIVGYLNVIYAKRVIGEEVRHTGNLGAFYVDRDYRGQGLGLDILRAITARQDVTYTTFSSNPPAVRLVLKAGMRRLDERRLLWHPRGLTNTGAEICNDVARFADRLSAAARQAMADHVGLGLESCVISEPGGNACLVIFYVKRKGEDIAYHEVLYMSDAEVFGRHAGAFAAHILPARQAVLSVDSRFLDRTVEADATEPIRVPRHYLPAGLEPADIDFLYSEIVLLSLKLY